ncbi:MAG TPA: hypothetical protein VJ066_02845 [Candidatus Bathyarchaeia archaeon]|nr:hypothetical protein [Candidatus Bathyarchaeia archaeon]
MTVRKLSTAKQVSIVAISAALYAVFFFLSYVIALPNFTLLYLPIILLGVFPLWFGLSGLVGSMIGAFIGGVFVENLGYLAWIEVITALIIYCLNWVLIPRKATDGKTKMGLFLLLSVYAFTLFVGLSYILWQFTTPIAGLMNADTALVFFLPTFALNYAIAAITCPALIRAISPKLRSWGIYSGTFSDWRSKRKANHGKS